MSYSFTSCRFSLGDTCSSLLLPLLGMPVPLVVWINCEEQQLWSGIGPLLPPDGMASQPTIKTWQEFPSVLGGHGTKHNNFSAEPRHFLLYTLTGLQVSITSQQWPPIWLLSSCGLLPFLEELFVFFHAHIVVQGQLCMSVK